MKKILIFVFTFVILAILLSLRLISVFKTPVSKPIDINSIKIVDLKSDVNQNPALSLKVLSANLVAEFDQATIPPTAVPPTATPVSTASGTVELSSSSATLSPTPSMPPTPFAPSTPPKITSLRILGEVENNGTQTVKNATPLITFFDSGGMQIATKVGSWSENYIFPILKTQQKYFYDLTIKSLPDNFANISINFKAANTAENGKNPPEISATLKIKDRIIEEKTATAQNGQEVFYYDFRALMINTGEKSAKNVRAVVYGKDQDKRVFTWGHQEFPTDLFEPHAQQNITLNLLPIKSGRLQETEVFLFGEEL
jgi:hypothetical protein